MLSFVGQLVESVTSFGGADAVSARKINYLPQEQDIHEDSDIEDLQDDSAKPRDQAYLQNLSPSEGLDCIIAYHAHCKEEVSARSAAAEVFAAKTPDKMQQLIATFCSRTSVARVAPSQKELEEFWLQCNSLVSSSESKMGKAMISTACVYALCGELSNSLGQEWKPQLRALVLLQFLYSRPGLERFIAEMVISESEEQLRHLSTDVEQCREHALQVLQLEEAADSRAPQQVGRVEVSTPRRTKASMLWRQSHDDSSLCSDKAAGENEMVDDDQLTTIGSSPCTQTDTSSSSDQDERFVPAWPLLAGDVDGDDGCADEAWVLFEKHSGFISVYGDLLVAEMTVEDAKNTAMEILGCKGFTFEGEDVGEPLRIYFKNKFDNVTSADWTSYRLGDGSTAKARPVNVELPASEVALSGTMRPLVEKHQISAGQPAAHLPSAAVLTPAEETVIASSESPMPERGQQVFKTDELPEAADPFVAINEDIGLPFFADLAEGSLHSASGSKDAASAGSVDFVRSTHASSEHGQGLSANLLDSDESVESLGPMQGSTSKQHSARRSVPIIWWGVEDEMPEPEDPFASLAEGSLAAF